MQRAKRNVPVYLREQQQAAEKAQEKLLLFKEQQKDKQIMEEEQVCMTLSTHYYESTASMHTQDELNANSSISTCRLLSGVIITKKNL